jgi:hypothetical protein
LTLSYVNPSDTDGRRTSVPEESAARVASIWFDGILLDM